MDHVEVLLFMHARPEGPCSAEDVIRGTGIAEREVVSVIQHLVQDGLVTQQATGVTYDAKNPDHDVIRRIGELYNSRPVTLVRAIYSRPSPIQSFSDAFRLRKDDDR